MSRKVLIVVSSFYPAMLADMQRARMLAWELPKLGWDVEILTPHFTEVRQDVMEPGAKPFFPSQLICHEVKAQHQKFLKWLGANSIVWRTFFPMKWRGEELLRNGDYDLIYFSTTAFVYFALGQLWKNKFNLPYVLDFHDPWVKYTSNQENKHKSIRSQIFLKLSLWLEKYSVARADGVVAVSRKYIDVLSERYKYLKPDWASSERHNVIPFGALELDYVEAGKSRPLPAMYRPIRLAYVGAGGPIMLRSFSVICKILKYLRDNGDENVGRVKIELFGTTYNWQAGDIKYLEQVACKTGVGDLVSEYPERVSYRRSLEIVLESSGVLILGVDDEGYMPSKMFSYMLSGKPLLASLRRESPAYEILFSNSDLGSALWFTTNSEIEIEKGAKIVSNYLSDVMSGKRSSRHEALEPFLAPKMAQRHIELFENCLK